MRPPIDFPVLICSTLSSLIFPLAIFPLVTSGSRYRYRLFLYRALGRGRQVISPTDSTFLMSVLWGIISLSSITSDYGTLMICSHMWLCTYGIFYLIWCRTAVPCISPMTAIRAQCIWLHSEIFFDLVKFLSKF